jgi:hypothetical protein
VDERQTSGNDPGAVNTSLTCENEQYLQVNIVINDHQNFTDNPNGPSSWLALAQAGSVWFETPSSPGERIAFTQTST